MLRHTLEKAGIVVEYRNPSTVGGKGRFLKLTNKPGPISRFQGQPELKL